VPQLHYEPDPSAAKSSEASQLVHASSRSPSSPYPELTLDTEKKEETVDKWEAAAKLAEQRRMDHKKGLSRKLEVCDLLDMRDVQAVAENAQRITEHMLREEVRLAIPSNFISQQAEITVKQRAFLVDQLAEHHYRFSMWPETLYVAIGVIDRFLALESKLKQSELQCLATTALHIAGKYEEIYPPDLKLLIELTEGKVKREEVLEMEFRVLGKL
jgi:G2/mitotic-specific cyclin 1/2